MLSGVVSPVMAANEACPSCSKNKKDLDIQEIDGAKKYKLLADALNAEEFKKLSKGVNISPSLLLKNARVLKFIDSTGKEQALFAVFPIGYENDKDLKLSSIVIPLSDNTRLRAVKYSITISGEKIGTVEFYSLDKEGNVKLIAVVEDGKVSVLSDDDYWTCVVECLIQDCLPEVGGICAVCLSPPAGPCYLALDTQVNTQLPHVQFAWELA
jgi:hypothetical protein